MAGMWTRWYLPVTRGCSAPRGRADFSTNKASLRFARVILERYNGQRGGRKLPYRFDG